MVNYRELNRLLKESCKLESEDFYRSIQDIKGAQERKLSQIITYNADTDFGKEHAFDKINSVNDLRAHIPITKYEDYESYITQIADGRKGVLTKDEVLMLEPTSGSTSPSKFIPYTESLKKEFRQGIFPWLYDLLVNRPKVAEGSFYWSYEETSWDKRFALTVIFNLKPESNGLICNSFKEYTSSVLVIRSF